jgi:hypothetical protein
MADSAGSSVTHRLLPILDWAPAYRRDWLLPDVLAGLALWAVRGDGLRGHRRCAARHGALHNCARIARLRAARHVAAAQLPEQAIFMNGQRMEFALGSCKAVPPLVRLSLGERTA